MSLSQDLAVYNERLNQAAGFDAVDYNSSGDNLTYSFWSSSNKKIFWISLVALTIFLISKWTKYPKILISPNAFGENAVHINDAKLDMHKLSSDKLKSTLKFLTQTISSSNPKKKDHKTAEEGLNLICEKIKQELERRNEV